MKFELKVILLSLLLSFVFMFLFTYISSFGQDTFYVYQVGIYSEEKNKNSKIEELKKSGYQSYVYKKEDKYYVLSMMTKSHKEILEHSSLLKGIIKQYVVKKDMTEKELLEMISKGGNYD